MSKAEHSGTSSSPNGESTLGDLFALSDEQILEIEPEVKVVSGQSSVVSGEPAGAGLARPEDSRRAPPASVSTAPDAGEPRLAPTQESAAPQSTPVTPAPASASDVQPPKWLAEMMADPQRGGEAKQLWEQTQQAGTRARQLEELDRAYFAGDGPARERLAETLQREDPAAFREMVFAGLRALEKTGGRNVAQAESPAELSSSPPAAVQQDTIQAAMFTQYAAFEKAANEELDRDVGGTIARALEQALPNAAKADSAPLRDRLTSAIRQDIEAALRGDRQLGEQVAGVLAAKRFDDTTRAQVVRLIGERARQLVPVAAKRVLSDWTQTALAAHRARAQKGEAAAARPDVEGVGGAAAGARAKGPGPREVDYRKLSDAQILDL